MFFAQSPRAEWPPLPSAPGRWLLAPNHLEGGKLAGALPACLPFSLPESSWAARITSSLPPSFLLLLAVAAKNPTWSKRDRDGARTGPPAAAPSGRVGRRGAPLPSRALSALPSQVSSPSQPCALAANEALANCLASFLFPPHPCPLLSPPPNPPARLLAFQRSRGGLFPRILRARSALSLSLPSM